MAETMVVSHFGVSDVTYFKQLKEIGELQINQAFRYVEAIARELSIAERIAARTS